MAYCLHQSSSETEAKQCSQKYAQKDTENQGIYLVPTLGGLFEKCGRVAIHFFRAVHLKLNYFEPR